MVLMYNLICLKNANNSSFYGFLTLFKVKHNITYAVAGNFPVIEHSQTRTLWTTTFLLSTANDVLSSLP